MKQPDTLVLESFARAKKRDDRCDADLSRMNGSTIRLLHVDISNDLTSLNRQTNNDIH